MRIRGAGERGRERWLAGLFNKVKRLSSTRAKLWRGRRSRSVGRRRSYKRQLTQADSRSSTANRRLIASAESERRQPRTSAHAFVFVSHRREQCLVFYPYFRKENVSGRIPVGGRLTRRSPTYMTRTPRGGSLSQESAAPLHAIIVHERNYASVYGHILPYITGCWITEGKVTITQNQCNSGNGQPPLLCINAGNDGGGWVDAAAAIRPCAERG